MNNSVSFTRVTFAGALTVLGAMWGKLGWLFVLWAVCAGLDFLTGSLAALRGGTWDSAVARQGIWHKAAMVVVVLVGMLFDLTLHEIGSAVGVTLPVAGVLVTPLLLSWYTVAELGSILENAIKMGAENVPAWLQKGLRIVSDGLYSAGETAVEPTKKDERHE